MAANYSVSYRKNRNSKKAQLSFEGNLAINNIEQIRKDVLTRLYEFEELEISVSNVSGIDLSFIQLLLAIQKTFKKGKVSFDFNIKDEYNTLLDKSGLNKVMN
ncbi:MAG: hypothetical protein C0594_10195 [Marinilabiliales bacterium]|nr:MAG: hypothetical protein C0594_10195 [Marinilabiliales bacterium]